MEGWKPKWSEVKDIATLVVSPMGELPALFRDATVSLCLQEAWELYSGKRNDEGVWSLINM